MPCVVEFTEDDYKDPPLVFCQYEGVVNGKDSLLFRVMTEKEGSDTEEEVVEIYDDAKSNQVVDKHGTPSSVVKVRERRGEFLYLSF